MEGLLPPLLSTTSTKQFFKNDEIKLLGEDRKKDPVQKQPRQKRHESVPLQYIKDNTKMSDKDPKVKDTDKQRPSKFKDKQRTGRNNEQKDMLKTTIDPYTPTPLSILQESADSGLRTQSLMRNSIHSSEVSVDRLQIKQQDSLHSNRGGPYLKSRLQLPALNRSQYVSLHNRPMQSKISPNNQWSMTSRVHNKLSPRNSTVV